MIKFLFVTIIIFTSSIFAQTNEENRGEHGIVSLFYPLSSLLILRVIMICCV